MRANGLWVHVQRLRWACAGETLGIEVDAIIPAQPHAIASCTPLPKAPDGTALPVRDDRLAERDVPG